MGQPAHAVRARDERIRLTFQRKLVRAMMEKGWNQSELARAAEVGRDMISTYVRGRSLPEPKNALKIANALGVDIDDLIPDIRELEGDFEPPKQAYARFRSNPDGRTVSVDIKVSLPWAQFLEAVEIAEPYRPAAGDDIFLRFHSTFDRRVAFSLEASLPVDIFLRLQSLIAPYLREDDPGVEGGEA